MPTQPQPKPPRRLQRLRRQLKAHGITQLAIAAAAGTTPPHVCNVLAGRDPSSRVIAAAEKLLADAANGGRLRPSAPDPQPKTRRPIAPARA